MKLSIIRVGDGPRPAVLLHGYLGSARNLWSLARAWSAADASRTLVLMDLTGHGSSPPLPPGAGLPALAADVLDTIRAEALTRPVSIVGHSLGGLVALTALEAAPDLVGRVTLLDIGPSRVDATGEASGPTAAAFARVADHYATREEARAALTAQGLPKPLVDWLLTNLVSRDAGFGWRVDRQALLDLGPAIHSRDLWSVAERHAASIHCIRGASSGYVSDADARRMEALGCQVDTLADAGHFVHMDQPAALLALLLAGA